MIELAGRAWCSCGKSVAGTLAEVDRWAERHVAPGHAVCTEGVPA